MDQMRAPLYARLIEHVKRRPISFHVPGHKYGAVFDEDSRSLFATLLSIDVTELSYLDDLHHPSDVIHEAQQLAADLYGVKKTYFLVNGSTAGNLAMVAAVCRTNKKVIVQRNCHKSILHALLLMDAQPIFVSPQFDHDMQVASFVSFETVEQTLREHSDAAALILTNPNYYGMAIDLTNVVQLAHSYNIPVLVDEAHAAHWVVGEPFPKSSVRCGADIVVQSAHKTLPAMTMGSFLHFNSTIVEQSVLEYFLQVFQTSSPSYPIMASLDLARRYVAMQARPFIDTVVEQIELFKRQLEEIQTIAVVKPSDPLVMLDPLKMTLQTRSILSGYELQQRLEKQGVFPELSDPNNVLFIYPLAPLKNIDQVIVRVKRALCRIPTDERVKRVVPPFPTNAHAIDYAKVKYKRSKKIQLNESVGAICAQMVIPYPPGIPIVLIGEMITKEHVQLISWLKEEGAYFQADVEDGYIEVFEEGT